MNTAVKPVSATPRQAESSSEAPRSRVYIALGSNLGDRLGHIARALDAIAELPETDLVSVSPVYESEPAYHQRQDTFANAVLEARTALTPDGLLCELQRLELEAGRVRTFPNAPRPLDLDILDYEGVCRDDESLVLPHPRLPERDFAVTPLLDIAPSCVLADGTALTRDFIAYGKVIRRIDAPTATRPDGADSTTAPLFPNLM